MDYGICLPRPRKRGHVGKMKDLFTREKYAGSEWESRIFPCPDGITRLVSLPAWFFCVMDAMIRAGVVKEHELVWEVFDTAVRQAEPAKPEVRESNFRNWFAIWVFELWKRNKLVVLAG